MRAIVINRCCKAEDLQVSDIPKPTAQPGWVVVKVFAAGMNHSEVILRLYEADESYINTPVVPGIECVGEIEESLDAQFQKGDRVVALMGGMGRSFNGGDEEYALLPVSHVFKVNTDMDWLSLAAVPESYFTAYGSLTKALLLKENDTLLVRGATSTIGQAAVQLGKASGAYVIGTSRKESAFEKIKALGADECTIDDGELSTKQLQRKPNKLLELIGAKTLFDSLRTVTKPGIVCNTGNLGGEYVIRNFDPIKYVPSGVWLTGFHSNFPTQEDMDNIFSLIKNHHIKPQYNKVFTLNQIVEAHTLLEKGGAGGKIILKIR